MTHHTVTTEERRSMVPVLVVFGAFLTLIACVPTAVLLLAQWIR